MRLFGIRIGVDASWFLVLFLMIFFLSDRFREALTSSSIVAYTTAVISALLFFASIVLHELGHALAARRQGIEVTGIDLWFLGGLAKLSRESDTPGEEFKVAAAGPLVTFAVIAACFGGGIAAVGWPHFHDALLFEGRSSTPLLLLVSWLGTINALLLVLNLFPAFPLDGGRIARALVWRLTGDRARGTRISARLGQFFGYALLGLGVLLVVRSDLSAGLSCLLLGWFIAQASRGMLLQSAFTERIDGVCVSDIMDTAPVSVTAGTTAARALDEYFLRYRWSWFPVVDASGRFAGVLREEAARAAAAETPVETLLDPAEDWRIEQSAPLETLLASEPLRRLGALLAVDRDGVLRGVVTLGQARRAIAAAVDPQPLGR
jgi:Zn-dependent protease/CBS domain-containing protein